MTSAMRWLEVRLAVRRLVGHLDEGIGPPPEVGEELRGHAQHHRDHRHRHRRGHRVDEIDLDVDRDHVEALARVPTTASSSCAIARGVKA